MRACAWKRFLTGAVVGLALPCAAQTADPNARVVGTFDGGTRQVLESIFIPPKPNAPFSLVLATEWSRPMMGGGTYTMANRRRIMRDSAGRIYEERWLLVPKGGKVPSMMNYLQIGDPTTHTLYNCETTLKKCFAKRYTDALAANYAPSTHPSGPLPNGDGILVHEDLGASDLGGLPVNGVRETTTINAGVAGNDQPMSTLREFWYSPQLGIDLKSRFESPSSGRQLFTVTEITTTEPEASFFQLPAGFQIVDQRQPAPSPE